MKGGELQRKNSLFKFLVCHVMLKVGPQEIVRIIKGLDNRKYEYY